MTDEPFRLEMHDDIAVVRPCGRIALDHVIARITAAIESARRQGIRKMLLVTTQLEDLRAPGDGTRVFLSREWALAAGGTVNIAVVARPELIDPQKIGVIVAKNFGASVDVFTAEADALAWLQRIR